MKVYIAGPFFNPEQIDVTERIEAMLGRLGCNIFSPRVECFCPPTATVEQRVKSFQGNCNGIRSADIVLARIDDFDPGTIWELGYGYGLRRAFESNPNLGELASPKLYAYTTVPSRGLNLMLAQSVDGFLQGLPSVWKFLQEMTLHGSDKEAQKWRGEII